jgi:hypothetical protein
MFDTGVLVIMPLTCLTLEIFGVHLVEELAEYRALSAVGPSVKSLPFACAVGAELFDLNRGSA